MPASAQKVLLAKRISSGAVSVTSSTAETEVTGIGDGVKGSGVGLRGAVTSALQRHREGHGDHHQEETAEEEPSPTAL